MTLKQKLNWLSSIPSTTGSEEKIINRLTSWVEENNYLPVNIARKNQVDPLGVLPRDSKELKTIFLAHVDRKQVSSRKLHFLGSCVAGQLDNIIGISAVMEVLKRNPENKNFGVLFTTEEEILKSGEQITEFVERYANAGTYIVDVDIDPITSGTALYKGISIRKNDSRRSFSADPLIETAKDMKVRYMSLDSWLLCQMTLLADTLENPTVFTGLPILNYHSNKEIAYYPSLKNLVKVLDGLLKREGGLA